MFLKSGSMALSSPFYSIINAAPLAITSRGVSSKLGQGRDGYCFPDCRASVQRKER